MIRWNGKNWIPAGVKPVIGRRRGAPVPGRPNARWIAGWVGGLGEEGPTPTPVTPTPSPSLSPTPTPTPTPSPVFYHIEAQNGDLLITQDGDFIDWFPL